VNRRQSTDGGIGEIVAKNLGQIIRFLRFDGAALYSSVPDLNVLWPLAFHGDLRGRVLPAVPGVQLVGTAFNSALPIVADAATIVAMGGSWLRAEGANTAIVLPLCSGSETSGVLALFSRYVLGVEPQTLRAVTIFVAHLNSALRRAPLLVISDIQRHQIEAVTRIIGAATSAKLTDERALYEMIAREARRLTGAHTVAFARSTQQYAFSEGRDGQGKRRSLVHSFKRARKSTKRTCTVLRRALPLHDLTLSLSWRSSFHPTAHQWRLVDLIASGLAAVEDVRARVAMAEKERHTQYLADVSRALAVSLDLSVVLDTIQHLFVPTSADCVAVDLVGVDEREVEERVPNDCRRRLHEAMRVSATAGEVAQGHSAGERFDPPLEGDLVESVIVPMIEGGRVIGSIAFGRSSARGPATVEDCALYDELTSYAAAAVVNAASFRKERDTAEILQLALLPTMLPADGRLIFDAAYAPAGDEAHVGGDWYDVFALDQDRFAVSIGDVGGHGMRAAITMNVARLAFRTAALGMDDPLRVLERGDAVLRLEHEAPLVTAIYGIVDLQRNIFSYASAGHLPPLLINDDGAITALPTHGIPLGTGFTVERVRFEAALKPGDTLVLYTDGLVEYARDFLAGERRLHELLQRLIDQRPRATLARDLHAATFNNGAIQNDDVAVLTISMRPAKRSMHVQMPAVPSSVPLLRLVLGEFWGEAPSKRSELSDFLLATGEAIANSVEHAYPHSDGTVSVRASYDGAGIRVEIADKGRYKTGGSAPDRGFGTVIMRALAHEVNIFGNDEGTLVRLAFR